MHAVGRRLHRHAAVRSQPGHRAHPAVGQRSLSAMKAVQATDELCFESIDRPPDIDQVRAQGVCRETVDGLVDECIDSLIHTVSCMGYRERFH
jgi:hypothetical protein